MHIAIGSQFLNAKAIRSYQVFIRLYPVLTYRSFSSTYSLHIGWADTILKYYIILFTTKLKISCKAGCCFNGGGGVDAFAIPKMLSFAQKVSLPGNPTCILLLCSMVGNWPFTNAGFRSHAT